MPTMAVVGSLTRDIPAWLAREPRTYAEAMEAWRTSCPRFTIREDALDDGLIRLERGDGAKRSLARVVLTDRGRATIEGA